MRLKVKLCDAVVIKNLVLAASSLPCDVDLQSGSFVVDAKSILGVGTAEAGHRYFAGTFR